MATKIRLQRGGHKGHPVYRIVVADVRAPRDGGFIEKLGTYDPNTNPATILLNFDRALRWIQVGAQPTDTARTILSKKGVMLMNHLLGGVKKGAFDEAEAKKRFEAWVAGKEKEDAAVIAKGADDKKKALKAALDAEKKVSDARKTAREEAEAAAKAEAEAAQAPAEEPAEETVAEEQPAEETPAQEEAPAQEETPAE